MPIRNRVNPFGELAAVAARGTLMGNRGCLHDARGEIVRASQSRAWITCVTERPGPKRPLLSPGQYTPLFFLDEATALAAGHRPCGECRREALIRFKRAWAIASGAAGPPGVGQIDGTLALQRGRLPDCAEPDLLPEGAMVADAERQAWLRRDGAWCKWSFAGYGPACRLPPGRFKLVTPEATVAAIVAGYRPDL